MRRLTRLNLAQRIVAVVALAGLLRTIGDYAVGQLTSPAGGWFGYAPLSEELFRDTFPRDAWRGVATTLVWMVLISAWGAASVWLLGRPYAQDQDSGRD